MKKTLLALLIICLLLSSAACSSSQKAASYSGGEIVGSDLTGNGGSRVFTAATVSIPGENSRAVHAVKTGSNVFIYAQVDNVNCFYFMGTDYALTKVEATSNYVIAIDGDSSGNAYVLSNDSGGAFILQQISPANEVKTSKLDFLSSVEEPIWDFTIVEHGYLFETPNGILCFNLSGSLIKEYGPISGAFDIIKNESEIVLTITGDDSVSFQLINQDFEQGNTYDIPFALAGISPGPQNGHVFAINSGIVYDINFTTGDRISYSNYYMSGEGTDFIYLSDKSYFSIANGIAKIYSVADMSESEETKIIKLATYAQEDYEIYDLLEAVKAFNEGNTIYKIDIVNYGIYDELGGEKLGLQRLNTDILAGNAPDIYDLSYLSYQSFYKSGLLENLYPFFNSSSRIKLDELTPSIVQALEYNGYLYNLVPSYTLVTMYGSKSIADPHAWTADTFIEIANETSINLFGPRVTKAAFLKYLLVFTGDEYIDIESASCNFVDSSFPAMLSIASTLPDSYDSKNVTSDDWGLIFTGQELFTISTTSNIIGGLCFADGAYAGNAVSLGFPSKNHGVAITPYMNLGMSSSSTCKEGVWRFFEYLLSDEYQNSIVMTVPIKQSSLETKLDQWIFDFSKMSEYKGWADNHIYAIPFTPATVATKEDALRIIDSVDCVNYCDDELYSLVLREAMVFFQGGETALQAANNIQSKVNVYVSEKYG